MKNNLSKKSRISKRIAFVFFVFVLLGVGGIIIYNYINANSNQTLTGNAVKLSPQNCDDDPNIDNEIKIRDICSVECKRTGLGGNKDCLEDKGSQYDPDRNYCYKVTNDFNLCVECISDSHCKNGENGKCNSKTKKCEYSGTSPVCSDGKDNDEDGLIDYPKDPGCSSANDNNEDNSPVPISGECNPDSARPEDNPCLSQGKCCIQSQNRFVCGSCDNTGNSCPPSGVNSDGTLCSAEPDECIPPCKDNEVCQLINDYQKACVPDNSAGGSCDNDGVCEVNHGETSDNCLHDCPNAGGENNGPAYYDICVPSEYKMVFENAEKICGSTKELLAATFKCGEHHGYSTSSIKNGDAIPEVDLCDYSWPNIEGPWETSFAGAMGPFQITSDTWKDFRQDGNGDGKKQVQNIDDAACTAAKILQKGGPDRYNPTGTGWYAKYVTKCEKLLKQQAN